MRVCLCVCVYVSVVCVCVKREKSEEGDEIPLFIDVGARVCVCVKWA